MGELKLVAFNYAPKGWALCDGQLLPINQNQALFSLFGTMYGGNGQTTFALPDLRGRVPIHVGAGFVQGQRTGEEFHTVTMQELPAHTHSVQAASGDATTPATTGSVFARENNAYADPGSPGSLTTVHPATVANVGGSQPHENRQPYLALNWCVALQGVFPSRN
jgi:microcystin-dependent protein